jgi:hypothetical protein
VTEANSRSALLIRANQPTPFYIVSPVEARGNTAVKGAGTLLYSSPPLFAIKYRYQQRRAANHSSGAPRPLVYK